MGRFTYLQLRRGTDAEWTSEDPILQAGEPAFSTDTGEVRIGDGVQHWSALTPLAGGGGVTVHADLTGLDADDHPQYTDDAEVVALAGPIADASATAAVGTHNSDVAAHDGNLLSQADADALYDPLDAAALALAAAQTYASDLDVAVLAAAEDYTDTERADHESDFDHSLLGGGVAAEDVSVDSTTLVGVGVDVQAVLEEIDDAVAALVSASHAAVTVGTGLDVTGQLVELDLSEVNAGGELGGTMDAPTVDATHSGSSHAATQSAAEATAAGALATHAGAADPHTGYRLESADHTHATSGLQAGQVDHGALGGLADDDHPQYATNIEFDDHSARHEDGGADEISIQGLAGTPVELTNHLNDTSDAHDASAISVISTTLVGVGTDVQAVLEELDDAIAAASGQTYARTWGFS